MEIVEQILSNYFPNQSCRIATCHDEHVWTKRETLHSPQCILPLNVLKNSQSAVPLLWPLSFIVNTISCLPVVWLEVFYVWCGFWIIYKVDVTIVYAFLCRFLCRDHYFTSATWITPTELCVIWLNRPQNVSVVTVCKSPLWICQEVIQFEKKKMPIYSKSIHMFYIAATQSISVLNSLAFIIIHPRLFELRKHTKSFHNAKHLHRENWNWLDFLFLHSLVFHWGKFH